jgi:hypothetical protein
MKVFLTGVLAITIAGTGVAYANLDNLSVETALDSMSVKEFARMNGISELVYNCAADVLAGKTAEELVEFIQSDAVSAGAGDFSPTASALKECIYLDPLGWHGTENEWAIELLQTDKWER